jgi:hypothetical protein
MPGVGEISRFGGGRRYDDSGGLLNRGSSGGKTKSSECLADKLYLGVWQPKSTAVSPAITSEQRIASPGETVPNETRVR